MKRSSKNNILYLIKNLWRWDKPLFFLSTIQGPMAVAIALVGLVLPKMILDGISSGESLEGLILKMLLPLALFIGLSFLKTGIEQWVWVRKILFRMKYTLKMVEKGLYTDYENIDGAEGQERFSLAVLSTSSNQSATEHVVLVLVSLLSNSIGFLIYAGIIFTLHPLIVGFVLLSSGINYLGGKKLNRYLESQKDELADVRRKLDYIGKTGGDFKAAKDLRLYGTENWFKENYHTALNKRLLLERKADLRRWLLNLTDGSLIAIRDVLTYGILAVWVLQKGLSIGDFALYFGAVVGISGWLSGIVGDLTAFNAMSLETQHLRNYLEMEDFQNRSKGRPLPAPSSFPVEIELINVHYRYPGAAKDTISGLNLHIKKGEKLALVGLNGAGKTTLVKLICGLYRPTSGDIKINGISMCEYNIYDYYKLFSVVFQDHFVLPMTLLENIALKNGESLTDLEHQRLVDIVEQVGLKEKISRLPNGLQSRLIKSVYEDATELSGGEMQKLMLAQALYKGAPIMILDEPTAALDPIAENEIYQRYNDLTQSATSLYISHRLSSTRFCDRIVYLEDGLIKEMGTHASLMGYDSQYKNLFDKQSHYYKNELEKGGEVSA